MTKEKKLLAAFVENLREWTCGYCTSGSNQPAATFRQLKNTGYKFEEYAPNRWARNMQCATCDTVRSHYKLLEPEPVYSARPRISITPKTRKRILGLLGNRDAFTGASISSTPEIDHKIPFSRLEQDIDANEMSDEEVREHFQLLTREHNLLKDRACMQCIQSKERTPFFGIHFFYEGESSYTGNCEGCGWYDGIKWREELNKII